MVPNHAFAETASGVPKSGRFRRLNRTEIRGHAFARQDLQAEVPSAKSWSRSARADRGLRWARSRWARRPFVFLRLLFRRAARATWTLAGLKPARLSRRAGSLLALVRKLNSTLDWLPIRGSRATRAADPPSEQAILKWGFERFRENELPRHYQGSFRRTLASEAAMASSSTSMKAEQP